MKKTINILPIFCIILNGFCIVHGISYGVNLVLIALNAFNAGAMLSALILGSLLDEANKLTEKCLEQTKRVLIHSAEIMFQQISYDKKGE